MNNIDSAIESDIQVHLNRIELEHDVTIIAAIESGSRTWGFPSPDSDYDVRFIYVHSKDWYIQLTPERDVIEVPINPVLDISGWDLRKAMNLANSGNSIVQEWLTSPIIYRQHDTLAPLLREKVGGVFNPKATYHHYYSMAKSKLESVQGDEVKLKSFFYFARATLSALWTLRKQSMPPIEFGVLLEGLTDDGNVIGAFDRLILAKSTLGEAEVLAVDPECYAFVMAQFLEFGEGDMETLEAKQRSLGNEDLRHVLSL